VHLFVTRAGHFSHCLSGYNPTLSGSSIRLENGMRIDLHSQYKNQAASYTEQYVKLAQEQNLKKIIFIVGRGNHSKDKIPVIKPLVIETVKGLGLEARTSPRNPGQIVVTL
jgi:hypothetical protein